MYKLFLIFLILTNTQLNYASYKRVRGTKRDFNSLETINEAEYNEDYFSIAGRKPMRCPIIIVRENGSIMTSMVYDDYYTILIKTLDGRIDVGSYCYNDQTQYAIDQSDVEELEILVKCGEESRDKHLSRQAEPKSPSPVIDSPQLIEFDKAPITPKAPASIIARQAPSFTLPAAIPSLTLQKPLTNALYRPSILASHKPAKPAPVPTQNRLSEYKPPVVDWAAVFKNNEGV